MGTVLLHAEDVAISFGGIRALKGVDVTVEEGQILCLAGENGCGKSTLVKIISGVYTPDEGTITIDGVERTHLNPRQAIAAGVQVIYQDLSLFDHLSVAENIAINKLAHDGSVLFRRAAAQRIAQEQLDRIGIELDLDETVASLSIANKQIVAICRALSMDARILFMDEPTTALTTNEVKRLLSIVLDLKARGIAVVFISHKLDEVFEIADKITIFRDGAKVGDFAASELDETKLSYYMTGREIVYNRYHREQDDERPVLEVRDLTRAGNYEHISFGVRPGDILGLTGLLGAGRTELALSLFGLNRPDSGEIRVGGKAVAIPNPWTALEHGIALLPEDRKTQGLFGKQSVEVNITSTMLDRVLSPLRLLSGRREHDVSTRIVHEMGVNNKNVGVLVDNLSGGNQQKVVLGKWIGTDPDVLILDSPTVGIDIGSKSEIYDGIHALAAAGKAIILISDEPEEIVANCNRVLVLHEGRLIATLEETELRDAGVKDRLAEIIYDPDGYLATTTSGAA